MIDFKKVSDEVQDKIIEVFNANGDFGKIASLEREELVVPYLTALEKQNYHTQYLIEQGMLDKYPEIADTLNEYEYRNREKVHPEYWCNPEFIEYLYAFGYSSNRGYAFDILNIAAILFENAADINTLINDGYHLLDLSSLSEIIMKHQDLKVDLMSQVFPYLSPSFSNFRIRHIGKVLYWYYGQNIIFGDIRTYLDAPWEYLINTDYELSNPLVYILSKNCMNARSKYPKYLLDHLFSNYTDEQCHAILSAYTADMPLSNDFLKIIRKDYPALKLEALAHAYQERIPVEIITKLTGFNYEDIEIIIEVCKKYGIICDKVKDKDGTTSKLTSWYFVRDYIRDDNASDDITTWIRLINTGYNVAQVEYLFKLIISGEAYCVSDYPVDMSIQDFEVYRAGRKMNMKNRQMFKSNPQDFKKEIVEKIIGNMNKKYQIYYIDLEKVSSPIKETIFNHNDKKFDLIATTVQATFFKYNDEEFESIEEAKKYIQSTIQENQKFLFVFFDMKNQEFIQ